MVSFSVLGQDFYEPTHPLYSFIAGTDYAVTDDGFPQICQCCVPIVNDDRLERNETFHLILERTPGLDDRIKLNPSYVNGTVLIANVNDGMYVHTFLSACWFIFEEQCTEALYTQCALFQLATTSGHTCCVDCLTSCATIQLLSQGHT